MDMYTNVYEKEEFVIHLYT